MGAAAPDPTRLPAVRQRPPGAADARDPVISDLGPACTGTIAIAPSANLNPEREFPSLFEPVHGSAPDIYGQNIANPIGQIWSGALMLEHPGHKAAAAAIVRAIEAVLTEGPRTRDIGGRASTQELGKAIAGAL
jgi:tartrate dehydrogenase/decarboxylase/D-malate dehydrogenase